jgi:hypothetical protein
MIDHVATALFILAATGLLGSPGPAIAALLAIGKTDGFVGSLKFFTGLQLGLGLAAAVSAGGLVAVLLAYLLKDSPADATAPAIRHVAAGGRTIALDYLHPTCGSDLLLAAFGLRGCCADCATGSGSG